MSNSNQDIATPIEFVRAVEDYFDIKFKYDMAASLENKKAPNFWDKSADSLSINWPLDGWIWLNPPFRNLTKWVNKCAEQKNRGCKIVSIWPLSGDKNQVLVWKKCYVHVIHGRIWPEVRSCMLVMWDNDLVGGAIGGLSWDKKELNPVW